MTCDPVFYISSSIRMKLGVRDLQTLSLSSCEFRENRRWEDRTLRTCVNGVTHSVGCALKPHHILRVENAWLCVLRYGVHTPFAVFLRTI